MNFIYYPFSLIFFFYGFNLLSQNTKKRRIKKVICHLIKLVIFSVLIFFLFYTSDSLFHWKNEPATFFSISLLIKTLVVIIELVYLTIKIDSVNSFLQHLSDSLTESEKKKVHTLNRIFSLIWLVFVITNVTVQPSRDVHLIILIILWGIPVFGLIVAVPLLLIIICYCVHLLEKRFQSVVNRMSDSNRINYDNLLNDILFVQSLKEAINSKLGLFPFLWFCELFSSTCLRLAQWTINHKLYSSGFSLIQGYVEFFQICLINLFYMFAINYFESQKMTTNGLFVALKRDKRCLTTRECQFEEYSYQSNNLLLFKH